MNWHARYLQQADWTHDLRKYLFERCGWQHARRMLEVGCGTGAVLQDPAAAGGPPQIHAELHGLDISADTLAECHEHVPNARLTCGDANSLPYASRQFDITYCHYLLLWVREPIKVIQEMKRVTAEAGYVLALAEPDYSSRVDRPAELAWLGQRQNKALERQGAALRRGANLAELFHEAGVHIIETGMIETATQQAVSAKEWESEWRVIMADLAGLISAEEIRRVQETDRRAWQQGEHRLNVPTYFACGQV